MKIVILSGSPRLKGTTAALLDSFTDELHKLGHDWQIFQAAREKFSACTGCASCDESAQCIFSDAMSALYSPLIDADGVVFVTPVYYFGFSSQLKKAVDRFYCPNGSLRDKSRPAMLIAAAADDDRRVADGVRLNYQALIDYLRWPDKGQYVAFSAWQPSDLKDSDHEAVRALARQWGKA